MYKHLRGVNAFMFFLMCSLKANPNSVPLGKQLVNEAVDTAELRLRETENRDVNLVSRSHEADDVWVGQNEVQDRTMSAMGKILLDPVNGKAISDIDGQSDRADGANGVFLRKVNVSVVPLLGTRYPQLKSNSKRSILCQRLCQSCSRSSHPEGNAHVQIFLVFVLV